MSKSVLSKIIHNLILSVKVISSEIKERLNALEVVASEGAASSQFLTAVLSNHLGHLSFKIGNLGNLEELVNCFDEAEVSILDKESGWVSHPDGKISNLPVFAFLESLSKTAVLAPSEEAA